MQNNLLTYFACVSMYVLFCDILKIYNYWNQRCCTILLIYLGKKGLNTFLIHIKLGVDKRT